MTATSSDRPLGNVSVSALAIVPLGLCIAERYGTARFAQWLAAAELDQKAFEARTLWLSSAELDRALDAARQLLGGDDELRKACGFRNAESRVPWPARGMLTVAGAYRHAASRAKALIPGGELHVEHEGPGHVFVRYQGRASDGSALGCLLRSARLEALPLDWNLPRAIVSERRCLTRGDACCEYDVRFCERSRPILALGGLALGLALGVGLGLAWLGAGPLRWLCAVVLAFSGLCLGLTIELARATRANLQTERASSGALRRATLAETAARQEMVTLEQQHREWNRLVEEQLRARSEALQRITEQVHRLQRKRNAKLKGFSHDIRNPLAAMRATVGYLQETLETVGSEVKTALEDLALATEHMEALLGELQRTAASDSGYAPRAPEVLHLAALSEGFRARLRALAYGKPVETVVTVVEGTPATIHMDQVHLVRIIDNLMTNAIKFTERGTVALELEADARELRVRVKDSGQGMDAATVQRLLERREPTEDAVADAHGWGVGLTVVMRLVDQLGGRLDLVSRPGLGSTFEVALPLRAPAGGAASAEKARAAG